MFGGRNLKQNHKKATKDIYVYDIYIYDHLVFMKLLF